MRSRWGTCYVQKKEIYFNTELAKQNENFIEYVVVHELVHLLEASHNKRFKMLMTHFLLRYWYHLSKIHAVPQVEVARLYIQGKDHL